MKLNELCKEIYNENLEKGFNVAEDSIGQVLMLIVSELSEALEADRKSRRFKGFGEYNDYFNHYIENGYCRDTAFQASFEDEVKDTFEDEIADAFIRLFDLCGALNIDIEKHIALKRMYNKKRPYKHNKKY